MMLRNKPTLRLAIYATGLVVVGALVLLNTFNVLNDDAFGQAIGVINTVGSLLGVGAIGTAFTNLGRQKINGSFDIDGGTPAEQLAQAVRNYAEQKAKEDAAVSAMLRDIPGVAAITQALGYQPTSAPSDPAAADYQPSLR